MAIVKKILDNFIKKYGSKKGKAVYFGWETSHPDQYKKGLKTAKKKGDKIINGIKKTPTKKAKTSTKRKVAKKSR